MTGRPDRTVARVAAAIALALLPCVVSMPALAQEQPTRPFAPDWGMLSGWEVFNRKGCGKCHALRGFGGGVGPDLARIKTGDSFFEIGAAMWNHLPRMAAKMREARIEPPTVTPRELADLIAFLFTAQYYDELGDPALGKKLFKLKGCVRCHEVGGTGGRVGPSLDFLKRANSPVVVAAAMWNHGPEMTAAMEAQGIPRPTFEGRELLDVIAYVVTVAKEGGSDMAPVVPGTPERGEKLFAEKQCVTCHSVGGKGGKVGPDLGQPGHHLSLTRFAGLMWNHGPSMWGRMKQRGIEIPRLTGQEMADTLAYLYTSRYFSQRGNAARGRERVESKGCLTCHSVHGKGGKIAVDFAASTVVGSAPSFVAGLWNHGGRMESQAQGQQVAWPALAGQELADISAYLGSLSKPANQKRRSK